MRRMDERELFTRRFDGVWADDLWSALERALATTDLAGADDTARVARFSTGPSSTSWGQHVLARVVESPPSGSTLIVRGRPRASLLTTAWGEKRHARGVQRQLLADVAAHLIIDGGDRRPFDHDVRGHRSTARGGAVSASTPEQEETLEDR